MPVFPGFLEIIRVVKATIRLYYSHWAKIVINLTVYANLPLMSIFHHTIT